nr:hypothetical protein [Tanacetum cinerariifolium]
MTPGLHGKLKNSSPYEMLQELKSMFDKQARVERFDLIQAFHACKQEEGKSVSSYVLKIKGYVEQLECLGYVLLQNLSVGLIMASLYEKGLPKKAATPKVKAIQGGRIQKSNKKSLNAKGKGKGKGKGKDKSYIPKPKNPKPYAKEHPEMDDACHHCKEVGHCKRNCLAYLAELIKKKKQVGTASFSDQGITIWDPGIKSAFQDDTLRERPTTTSLSIPLSTTSFAGVSEHDVLESLSPLLPIVSMKIGDLASYFSSKISLSDLDIEYALSRLLQRGTVADYQNEFEMLISRVIGKSKSFLASIYIFGLKPSLQRALLWSNPTTLGEAFSLAQIAEARFEYERSITDIAKTSNLNAGVQVQDLEETIRHKLNKVEAFQTSMVATFEEHEQQENQDNMNEFYEEKDGSKPRIFIDTVGKNGDNDSRTSGSKTPTKEVVENGIESEVVVGLPDEFQEGHMAGSITTLTAKLPILNPKEYDLWLIRIEKYFLMTDYSLWEVIKNGNKVLKRTVEIVEQIYEPNSAEEKLDRKNEMKARGTLLMALPYGGNKESKKVQRTLLKQQYKNFATSSSETLDQTFDRLQKLISQLEIQGEVIEQEDMNLKLLRSIPSEWKTHALIWRNKAYIETISFDDLYNKLKIYEPELTGSSSTSQNLKNMAFVSSNSTNSTSSTNEADNTNTAFRVSTAHSQGNTVNFTYIDNLSDAVIYAFLVSQPNSPQLAREDLEQIDHDDLEEMDLHWEMAMLTIRARRAPKNQENRGREYDRKTVPMENPTENSLIAQDGIRGYDWSYQDEEEHPTNYALMALTSSRSSSTSDSE